MKLTKNLVYHKNKKKKNKFDSLKEFYLVLLLPKQPDSHYLCWMYM